VFENLKSLKIGFKTFLQISGIQGIPSAARMQAKMGLRGDIFT
jgi:hypothetical protein